MTIARALVILEFLWLSSGAALGLLAITAYGWLFWLDVKAWLA